MQTAVGRNHGCMAPQEVFTMLHLHPKYAAEWSQCCFEISQAYKARREEVGVMDD